MKKQKEIAQLVRLSMTKGKLDPKKISFIAKKLSKRELVLYHRQLLRKREVEKAYITTATDVPDTVMSRLSKLFPGKDLVFLQDASILSGMKIQLGDLIFDASLLAYLDEMRRNREIN